MDRRQFMKSLLWLGAASAVVGGAGVLDYVVQLRADAEKNAAELLPGADLKRHQAYEDLFDAPTRIKIIGVDHGEAEIAIMEDLARPETIKTLQRKKVTAVFQETSTLFADLYRQAPRLTAEEFAALYLRRYPDNAIWDRTATVAEKSIVARQLVATHGAICALAKEGIALIPYDTRHGNNLGQHAQWIAAIKSVETNLEDALLREQGFIGLARRMGAFLVGGGEAQDKISAKLYATAFASLKKRGDPAYTMYESVIQNMLSKDGENWAEIQKNMPKEGETLILCGQSHISRNGALAERVRQEASLTTAFIFDDRGAVGAIAANDAILTAREESLPEYYISLKRGELIATGNKPNAAERSKQNLRPNKGAAYKL